MIARRILARILYLLADGIDLLAEALSADLPRWEQAPTQSPTPIGEDRAHAKQRQPRGSADTSEIGK